MESPHNSTGGPKLPLGVLILTHGPFPPDGRIEKEVSSLSSRGIAVTVVANKSLTKARVRNFRGAEVLYVWMATPFGIPFLNLFGLVRKLKNRRYDVIQVCDAPLGLIGVSLSIMLKRKLVYDAHEAWPLLALFGFRNLLVGLLSVPMLSLSELALVRHARKVITVSEGVRVFLARCYGVSLARIQVVRNYPAPADVPRPTSHDRFPGDGSFKLIYIGSIDGLRRNELSQYIKTMRVLRDTSTAKYTLMIVGGVFGGRPPPGGLVNLARSLGVSDCVKFTGWLPLREALQYASSADLGLIGCEKNAYTDLGLANKLFEYILIGLPVLTANLSEFRRALGEEISYYLDNDPQVLAEVIEGMRLDYPRVRQRALNLESVATVRMTWRNEEEKYIGVFDLMIP